LQVRYKLYVLPVGEEQGESLALAVADLHGEQAARQERGASLWDQAAIDIETGGTGEESLSRLVVAHLRIEIGAVTFRNVRRIADDGVEEAEALLLGKTGEKVGRMKSDAVGEVVRGGVFAGYDERLGRDVDGGDPGLRQVGCERQRDGSGAGAHVKDVDRAVVGETAEHRLDEVLGLGPGNERGWSDLELEAEELLLAGDVLDGLVAEPAGDGGVISFELL